MMNKSIKLVSVSVFLTILLGVSLWFSSSVIASTHHAGDVNDDGKIEICHASNSQTNPYEDESVNKSSILTVPNGHDTHNGPIWFSGIADHTWGDIIPSFAYQMWEITGSHLTCDSGWTLSNGQCTKSHHDPVAPTEVMDYGWVNHVYNGKNWPEGANLWSNDCEMPQPSPTPSPSPSPSPSPTPSPTPSPSPSPSPSVSPSPSPTPDPTPSPSPSPEVSPSPTPEVSPEPSPSPEVSPSPEPSPEPGKTTDLVVSTLSCDNRSFDAYVTLKNGQSAAQGVKVRFIYNGKVVEATTDAQGKAQAGFGYEGDMGLVVTNDGGYPEHNRGISLPSDLKCESHPNGQPENGEVLGASTLAETGIVEDTIMKSLGSLGSFFTLAGSVLYAKKKNQ